MNPCICGHPHTDHAGDPGIGACDRCACERYSEHRLYQKEICLR